MRWNASERRNECGNSNFYYGAFSSHPPPKSKPPSPSLSSPGGTLKKLVKTHLPFSCLVPRARPSEVRSEISFLASQKAPKSITYRIFFTSRSSCSGKLIKPMGFCLLWSPDQKKSPTIFDKALPRACSRIVFLQSKNNVTPIGKQLFPMSIITSKKLIKAMLFAFFEPGSQK